MAVGAWRKVAISCSGTTGRSYVATVGGATEMDSGTVAVGTPTGITVGGRAPSDGTDLTAASRTTRWTAELSQAEIEARGPRPPGAPPPACGRMPLTGVGDLNEPRNAATQCGPPQ